jgi:hypothetical protein
VTLRDQGAISMVSRTIVVRKVKCDAPAHEHGEQASTMKHG